VFTPIFGGKLGLGTIPELLRQSVVDQICKRSVRCCFVSQVLASLKPDSRGGIAALVVIAASASGAHRELCARIDLDLRSKRPLLAVS